MVDPNFAGKPGPYQPCRTDLDQMPDTPTHGSHHRRAASETFSRFSDILLDDGVVLEFPPAQPGPSETNRVPAHLRSLSVDTDFFEELGLGLDGPTPAPAARVKHRHSNSMDGYSSATSAEVDSAKRAMPAEKLAELALMDPKRARRILANRQSAARSKERKIHYTSELERKVQTLQTEATTLSAQVTLLQRDTTELTNENKELKFKLQAMEQQAHLRDALNDAMRNELQQLKIAAGQVPAVNGNNRGFSTRPPTFPYFNNARLSGQSQPVFQDFNNGV